MTTFKVPFADLYAQYLSVKDEIDSAIAQVIRSSAFIRGPMVTEFEAGFAEKMGVRHCVSCANGTDALYIALRALGVGAGDEVIVPAHSWISTSASVTQAGGSVVFADTDGFTYTIDPSRIEEKITSRTVGIVPVHLYGQPADMDAVMAIARRHGLWVLEDCAQAHLARFGGRSVGTFGSVAAFSFYPGKNLGAMGDGGALLTNDQTLAEQMARLARHGGLIKGEHVIEGINSRLDGLQAAILSVKLRHLATWTLRRQRVATEYSRLLAGIEGLLLPQVAAGREHVYHLYVVGHARRDELAQYLSSHGIQTVINYPVALPFLPAYTRLRHRPEDFPDAHSNQSRVLSLPMFAEITDAQISMVAEAVRGFAA
jgi:dTDP-4-amino-4,6-dideoxygalactose transaminase